MHDLQFAGAVVGFHFPVERHHLARLVDPPPVEIDDLDADRDAARSLLGAEAWDLLRPDHEPPEDRFGPGMPVEDITKIVTAVEDLSR